MNQTAKSLYTPQTSVKKEYLCTHRVHPLCTVSPSVEKANCVHPLCKVLTRIKLSTSKDDRYKGLEV